MNNKFFIAYAFIFCMFLTSCDDNLNLNPSQSLSEEEALQDLSGLNAALNGVYDGFQSVNHYGREFLVLPEIEADNVYLSIANSNRFVQAYDYSWTPDNGDITGMWNQPYNTILKVNRILQNIDGVDGDAAVKNQIKGEALMSRALCYFDLVRFFARPYTQSNPSSDLGVPITLVSAIEEPARNTIQAVYDQVKSDINEAKGLMSDNGIFNFSPDAADALMARVALYSGDWGTASSMANAMIAKYPLATDIVAAFAGPGSSEEIFTLRAQVSENRGSDNHGNIYNPDGYGDIRVTTDLISLYEATDTRLAFIYTHTDGEMYHSKFAAQEGTPGLVSPKLLRVGEMYLISAEADLQNGNAGAALTTINTLRAARGASALASVDMASLMDERSRELAFEGHRAFDLYRNGMDMVRDQCNTGIELSSPDCTISASDFRVAHPIPQREMDVNQSMVQNPGY